MMRINNICGVANQFRIETKEDIIFQSYDSIIAVVNKFDKSITLDKDLYDYSKTTKKYLCIFFTFGPTTDLQACRNSKTTERSGFLQVFIGLLQYKYARARGIPTEYYTKLIQ